MKNNDNTIEVMTLNDIKNEERLYALSQELVYNQ